MKFSLLKEDCVCEDLNQYLAEWFGEGVTLQNIIQKICLISPERPESSTGVEIISTGIKSFRSIKGSNFQVWISLNNGLEIQMGVAHVKNIPGKETVLTSDELLSYCTAEDNGWHPCQVMNPSSERSWRIWKSEKLISAWSAKRLPFNAIMKIV